MSTTIDQRVVEMKFDNRQFERNVQTSLGTLDKLKQSLNLTGAAKGLENVGSAAKGIDMNPISNGVETVRTRFSALGVMAVTTLANITNSAVNAGKKIVSSLTIDPIKTGLAEYETQINAVQTILANTRSKGTTLDQVNGALDTLNAYADKTIYNFTEMTRNIGTFTAAGIDLDTSVNAIQGIANLAAVSGSTSQQASTAMYQLSQALSSGTVRLMDWNSVVNAGMGGQVFQDALKQTSKELNTGAEAAIKAKGSFRESLQTGWLTAEVLTETLKKFTTSGANEYVAEYTGLTADAVQAALDSAKAQYGEADAIDKAAEALAKKSGKDKGAIKEALELAKSSEDAATKVKTFSQLMDTLKESVQSGWTQTWEILIGDFEQAKELWSSISDYFGKVIGDSAEARNNVLQGWADAGGREKTIEAIKNAFQGLLNIIRPIREAFVEVFPPATSEQLIAITDRISELAAKFKSSTEKIDGIKSTFKGLFSIIDIGVTFVTKLVGGVLKLLGSLVGLSGGLLGITGSIGDWISGVRDSIKETDSFGVVIDRVVGFLQNGVSKIKEFFGFVKEKFAAPGFEGFLDIMERIGEVIKKIGSKIVDVGKSIGEVLSGAFSGGAVKAGLDTFNTGIFSVILLGITKFVKGLGDAFDNAGGFLENLTGIFDDVRGCFEAYQQNLKAGVLLKIAGAIAILAGSLVLVAMIDPERLGGAIAGITMMFGELVGTMAIFDKMGGAYKNATKATVLMIGISTAVFILAGALKKIAELNISQIGKGLIGIGGLALIVVGAAAAMSKMQGKAMKGAMNLVIFAAAIKILASACKDMSTMKWEEMAKGLIGVGALMLGVSLFLNNTKFSGKAVSNAIGVVLVASAIKVLASACGDFGSMDWNQIGKGLAAIGGLLAEIAIFTNLTGNASHVLSTGAALVLIAASMKIFASAVSDFATLSWDQIARGLVGMAGALAAVTLAVNFMPKNLISVGVGLLAVSGALVILAQALTSMSGMTWEEIGRGMVVLGGSMLILAVGLNVMNGTLAGSAALLVAAAALSVITPVMERLGGMSWAEIGKGLLTIAGIFAVLGVAGLVLTPIIPSILGLAGALALIGVAVLGVGVGLAAAATGLTALAAAGTAGAAAIVASLTIIITGLIGLIPTIVQALGNAIIVFCQVIITAAPMIGAAIKTLVLTLVDVLVSCAPALINGVFVILLQLLTALDTYLPLIVEKAVSIAVGFIEGLCKGIGENTGRILEAIKQLGIDIWNAICEFFGIHSPSTKFAEIGTNLIEGLINGVKNMISGAVSTVVDLGKRLVNTIGEKASAFLNKGKELMTKLKTGIENKVASVKSAAKSAATKAISGLKEKLSDFKQAGKDLLSGFVEGIKSKVQSAKNAAADIGKKALSSIKSFLGINSPSKEFIEVGKYTAEGLANGITDNAPKAEEASTDMSDSVLKAIEDSLAANPPSKAGEKVSKGVAAGITNNKEPEEAAAKKAQAIVDTFKTTLESAELDSTTSDLEYKLWEAKNPNATESEKLAAKMTTANNKYQSQLEQVKTAQAEYDETLKAFGKQSDYTQKAYNKLVTEQTELYILENELANLAKQQSAAQESVRKSQREAWLAYSRDMAENKEMLLAQGFSLEEIQTAARRRYGLEQDTTVAATTTGVTEIVGAAMTAAGGAITDVVSSEVGNITQAMSAQCTDVLSASRDEWYTCGQNAVMGFVEGMRSKIEAAAAAAAAIAQAAYAAAMATLGIASPSKEFAKLGMYSAEGMAKGLIDYSDDVRHAASEVGNEAIRSLGNSISAISDVVNSDIDSNPVIRPILDLTNIQNGANHISGMFSNRTAALASVNVGVTGTNLNAILSGMAESNSGNSEVVSAISELRSDFGSLINAIGSMHIRMDSGTVVGELIGKIDAGLGQISTHKGRGN